ncbi:transmembrane protein 65-like [Babylonia areolata]|uniref:transmembrane protein 65-like n=1 Tax=Babylonia areolata TaxID=304850 RepID=UPI003FD3CF50
MSSSLTLRLCQRGFVQKFSRFSPMLYSAIRVYHATSLPLYHRHSWLTHEQVPNKFVTMYRDIHRLHDEEAAREFVFALNHQERERLMAELINFQDSQGENNMSKPSSAQLRLVCLHQALPFIGFGFLDNFLMIVAGEYIDLTLGAAFGISTMAAAGYGNLISDVAGVGSAYYVESFVAKFGFRTPRLTPAQVDMKSTRYASSLGKMIGVAIGCFIGMFPLLFFQSNHVREDETTTDKDNSTSSPASS